MTTASRTAQLYHNGDKTITVVFDVKGDGRAAISYALHTGDAPTRLTVPIPWTHTVEVAVAEPGLSPTLTALNTDPHKTVGCQIATSQLAMNADHPLAPNAPAECSAKVRHSQ